LYAVKKIRELAKSRSIGPNPSFTQFDLVKTLETVDKEKTIGRTLLSKELGLGQGATRTILDHLERAGLVEVRRLGCVLTSKGSRLLKDLRSIVRVGFQIPQAMYPIGRFNCGALVSKAGQRIKKGLEQRDAAIKVGASGATTFVYRDGALLFPPEEVASKEWSELSQKILEVFQPSENDVVIITGASSPRLAEAGARAAAWTLLENDQEE
jgi:predicted transcriptional regulator